jgi:hypothetical protein
LKGGWTGIDGAEADEEARDQPGDYLNWRSKCGEVTVTERKRMKELEAENSKLKRMYADLVLENAAIKNVLSQSCNAVCETAGRRGVRERASTFDPARLPNRGTVPDGVLPNPERCCGARRCGHLRAQRDRSPTASVGLLEVLRSDAPRWASVEPQARASRVLGAPAESGAAHEAAGTDAPQSEYKYVPVRRTALFIAESLHRGLQWAAFEPNGEPLWAQIRLSVGTFLDQLWRQGAFQGTSPREAYFVKCGTDTTTQADIDHGLVNIEVGFAPLKPAEFVILRIQQLATRSLA